MQVPRYQYPTVMPSGQPLSYQRFDTNPDMFGGGIAKGLAGLASGLSQWGAAIEANGKKMAAERADADASAAYVDYRLKAGALSADYLSLPAGQAAPAYDTYIKDLSDLRRSAMETLTPEAKAKFESTSRDSFLSDADQAAMAAAKGHQSYLLEQAKAKVDLAINDSATKFMDEPLFESNLRLIDQTVADQGTRAGWTPEQTLVAQQKVRSAAWAARLNSMADSDPIMAWQTFGRIRDGMTTEERLAAEGKILSTLHTQGAGQAAKEFLGGMPPASPSLVDGIVRANVPKYWKPEDINLAQGVDNKLLAVVTRASEIAAERGVMFGVGNEGGLRSQAQQDALVAKGFSKTRNSYHRYGTAIDLWPLVGGMRPADANQVNMADYDVIASAMLQASQELGIPVEPGPGWDRPHWQLVGGRKGRMPVGGMGDFAARITGAESAGGRNIGVVTPGTEASMLGLPSSSAGAMGVMQVMPATARTVARQLGIPFDLTRLALDPEYNRLIGTTYLNQMLEMFGGNETLAAAAYNAGPGRVKNWIARFGFPRTPAETAAWAAQIPIAETRNYVAKVTGGSMGTGLAVNASMPQADFAARLAAARQWADATLPGDAIFADAIEAKMTADYNQMKDLAKAQADALYETVGNKALEASSLEELLGDQATKDAYEALAVDQKTKILEILKRNAAAEEVKEDEGSIGEYERLIGESVNSPEKFLEEDIYSNGKLTTGQKTKLIDRRAGMKAGKPVTTPEQSLALRIMKPQLDALGLSDEDYALFTGKFMELLDYQTGINGGKALSEAQIREAGNTLLRVTEDGWFSDTLMFQGENAVLEAKRLLQIDDTIFESVIDLPPPPPETRRNIIERYVAKTGKPPTEQQIRDIWIQLKFKEKRK